MTVMGGSVVCDCVFVENSGYQGAAIVTAWHTCCGQPEPVIENCTFYRNETLTGGAAVFLRADEAVISHCIFANTINGWGAVILGGSGEVECNDFWMNDLGTYGCGWCLEVGNFEADPMFCDPENGDFHISDNSPCQPRWHDGYPCGRVGALGSCSTSSAEGPAGAPGDDSPLIVVGNPVTGGGGDATVWFTLARSGTVSGSVHACDGRKVVDLGLQSVAPGRVEVPVPMPRDLPSGTYYVKMQTPDGARTARLVLLR
jgi:hypothetical protein